jgi:hypothetical protein
MPGVYTYGKVVYVESGARTTEPVTKICERRQEKISFWLDRAGGIGPFDLDDEG